MHDFDKGASILQHVLIVLDVVDYQQDVPTQKRNKFNAYNYNTTNYELCNLLQQFQYLQRLHYLALVVYAHHLQVKRVQLLNAKM